MKRLNIIFAAIAVTMCFSVSAVAQNGKVGQGIKSLGKTFKDAITETARDAKDAITDNTNINVSRSSKGEANNGPTYYVSILEGSNRNLGTSKEAPFKNIQKALDVAPEGSVILVAEGNYYGILNSGNINITKPVSIFGGYSLDFSERNVLTHRTTICPTAESNGSQNGQGTMQIQVRRSSASVVIDGLLFDRGNSVAYSAQLEGQPEGVQSPMMVPIGTKGIGGPDLSTKDVFTAETAIIYFDRVLADVTISNCAFVNAPSYAIRGMLDGKATIKNNVFVNVRMAAVELSGCNVLKNGIVQFCDNTVLFVWSRSKDMQDMGYGYRYMTKVDSYLDHNIIGLTSFAGLDRTHVDSPAIKEDERVTTVENSVFFLNKKTDLTLPGGGSFLMVKAQDFEDVSQLAKVSGNKSVTDPSLFKGKINEAYLNGFLSASMFANRYPFEDALKLFGAVDEYGAQVIK